MTRNTTRRALGVFVALATIGAASACGAETQPSSAAGAQYGFATAGTITAAITTGDAPFASPDANGKPVGLLVEMNDIIAKRLGVNIVYKVTALSGGLAGLTSGQYDLMSVHMSQTPERAASVSFTKPIIWSSDVLAVPTDSPISSPEQTAGKRIGATTGSAQLQYVQENLTSARLISEPSDTASISEILANRLDGVALSSTNASAVLGANKSTIKMAFSKLHDGPSAEAVNKKLTTFLTAYNDQLSALATDGTMLRLYEKFFPDLPYPTQMYQYWPAIQQQVAKEGPR